MKRIIALIFVNLFCFSISAGCEAGAIGTDAIDIERIQYGWNYDVYYDTETKVMYLKFDEGGLTVMYNADGTPRLYGGE